MLNEECARIVYRMHPDTSAHYTKLLLAVKEDDVPSNYLNFKEQKVGKHVFVKRSSGLYVVCRFGRLFYEKSVELEEAIALAANQVKCVGHHVGRGRMSISIVAGAASY